MPADTYALGVLLFEMLAGRAPLEANGLQQWAQSHSRQRPPEIRGFRSEASLGVSELLTRMLAKDPLRRPGDGDLVRWLAELEIEELAIKTESARRDTTDRALPSGA
jgi:serine/threonine protein kinase